MTEKFLTLNGNKFYYDEIAEYSFRNSIPLNGYESKTLEFCRNWLTGVQEFPIQTSGSTGVPKTITLTRQQLEASARRTINLLKLQKGDTTLVCLNTEYIAGMMMLARGFLAEMDIIVVDPISNPLSLLAPDTKVDFASFVPMQLQTILVEAPEMTPILNQMKAILVGGAPVNPNLRREMMWVEAPIYHTYGMTETASHIALRLLNGAGAAEYYEALDTIKLGLDSRGCLTIQGDVTNNELLATNDIVELLTPTRFRWIGRVDNTINSGGVKVQIEKVEVAVAEAMIDAEKMPRYFIASQPDELLGEKIILVMESEPLAAAEEEELLLKMRKLLKRFEMPRGIYYITAFTETATGKIQRQRTMQKLGLVTH
ncbi:AMP-binding protein [Pontibacter arcticus]|uniref:Acyl-CoA synthetase n=1 Tax=Pontibacter arcticus TaxID=2080288 RepID=A0A364RGG5_9BACT|nr:AMP-binding protein [Pontibacter arcticus]RAU83372.1 acyl-CoA synthetase [Pontibacter arcticus]